MASLQDMFMVGRSGLLSQQTRLATIGQNLSNVDTAGYHRRTANLSTAPAPSHGLYDTDGHPAGNGVAVLEVVRSYNATQEDMLRTEQSTEEFHAQKSDSLASLESMLNGTGDGSLSDQLAAFWTGWQDVASSPANTASRGSLTERASSLTDYFGTLSGRLADYRKGIVAGGSGPTFSGTLADTVDAVNALADRIQGLNRNIHLSGDTSKAQDLLDKRDQALGDLSKLASIGVADDGTVTIDGRLLVSGDGATRNPLTLAYAGTPPVLALDGAAVTVAGGGLRACTDMAAIVDDWSASIDSLASTLMADVNAIHTAAYDLNGNPGVAFFTGADANGDGVIDAGSLAVNPLIHDPANPQRDNPRHIAAAATLHDPGPPPIPNAGDGTAAQAIADLGSQSRPALNNRSYGDFFTGKLAVLGASIQSEQGAASDASAVSAMLSNAIQQQSGVNVDQEVADMMATQRSYEAAARLASVVDSMIDTIINKL